MTISHAFIENYRFLARYNQWINRRLYDCCEQLTDEQRKEDGGAYFGSIHRTLNHIIVTDQVWLRRFEKCAADNGLQLVSLEGVVEIPEAYQLQMVPHDDWQALKNKRYQLDAAIKGWVSEMPEGYTHFIMRYSNSKGTVRDHPAWQAMTHLFNHQTHHRSQAITLLTQAGLDIGVTDMLALM